MYLSTAQSGNWEKGYGVRLSGGRAWTPGITCRMSGVNCQACNFHGVCRLGAASAEGEVIGKSILTSAAVAGPAAPYVAAVGDLVSIISDFFGGGCGSACTESSTLEQVPEAALQNLHNVAQQQPGAITASQFQTAWQEILNYGVQNLQKLQASGDSKAAGGITNLENVTDYTSFVATLPATQTAALNLSAAQSIFLNPAASGWEPGAVSAGNSLALQVLQQIASGSTSSIVTSLETATGLPGWALLAGAAALAWAVLGGRNYGDGQKERAG